MLRGDRRSWRDIRASEGRSARGAAGEGFVEIF